MNQIILASHGGLAAGAKDTLEMDQSQQSKKEEGYGNEEKKTGTDKTYQPA